MSITNYVNSSNQKAFNLTTFDKVNYSSTQSKFTFSKAERFPTIKANNPVSCYDIPTTKSTRAAGMGYGATTNFSGRSSKCHLSLNISILAYVLVAFCRFTIA